jgi:hypothetical protein
MEAQKRIRRGRYTEGDAQKRMCRRDVQNRI